ncbi:MAG: flagellar biosynthetic protein FliO [Granulosicoccus sp.]|nr:flagellar biosynthetic protein FliO [Granulosicoccus sp.]
MTTHPYSVLTGLLLVAALATVSSSGAIAADAAPSAVVSGFSMAYFGKLIMTLVAVLAFFLVFAWSMRRYQSYGQTRSQDLSVVASLSLGTRERLVVVQAGSQQVLLGITSTQISSLAQLDTPLDSNSTDTQGSLRSSFEHILKREAEEK